jgi:hypothetical protein
MSPVPDGMNTLDVIDQLWDRVADLEQRVCDHAAYINTLLGKIYDPCVVLGPRISRVPVPAQGVRWLWTSVEMGQGGPAPAQPPQPASEQPQGVR